MNHIQHAWKEYAADFSCMTDEEIEKETRHSQDMVDEHEAWLEAVASWEQAGRPRNKDENMTIREWLENLEKE